MADFSFKEINRMLGIKEWGDIGLGVIRYIFGKREATPKSSEGGPGGPETIAENASREGELNSLHIWLSTLWVDDATRAINYQVKPEECDLFEKIVAKLPNGAITMLLRTIAAEVTPIHHQKTTGNTEIEDPKNPAKVKQIPILVKWEELTGLKGQQVVNALTWRATVGQGTEDERVEAVAKTLLGMHVLDNAKDTAAAGLNATKEKAAKVWGRLREWYGEHDTDIHLTTARYLLKDYKIGEGSDARPAIDVLLESDEALEWIQKIDAAEENPAEQRELQEGMQLWLQEKVLAIRKCKGALRDQERRQNTSGQTNAERSERQWRFIYIVGGLAILTVLVIGGFQAILK